MSTSNRANWANWLGVGIGIILFLIYAGGIAKTGLAGIVFGMPFGLISGILLWSCMGTMISERIAGGVFSPDIKKAPPPEFAAIRNLVSRGELAEAAERCREILAEKPDNPHILCLLADIYIDRMEKFRKAAELISAHLRSSERTEHDSGLVMRLVDAYLELGETRLAINCLKNELKLNYGSKADRKSMENRLAALEETQ